MEAIVFELPNGLRVIYKYIPYTRIVHCGYVINSGSRDDNEKETGMAHFIEHMVFKGTEKRDYFEILNYLDSLGGDLNAYTTKEKTCLYASLRSEYFDRAVDLLTDITFYSTFPSKEVSKEKEVISEEIDMYREAPDEAIFEDFDEMVYPQHSLGHPILGTKESVKSFTRQKTKAHIQHTYTAENIVFSIVGNVSAAEVQEAIDRYLRPQLMIAGNIQRRAPEIAPEKERIVSIPTQQTHEILGGRAYSLNDPRHVPFLLLNNMLGGPAMNSLLNLNVREKYGLTYSINSFYTPFVDSGIWGIYYACEPKNLGRIRQLVRKELRNLVKNPWDEIQLSQAKRQLIGQMTLSYESLLNQMLGMAKDLLDYGRIIEFNEIVDNVESIQALQLAEVANELFKGELAKITYQKTA